jgi:predicted ester cyclase
MTIEENKQVVRRFNKEFLETGNPEVLKEIVADTFTNHTAAPGTPKDISGIIQFITALHKGFSDISIQIDDIIGEGDMVASRKTISATHTGEMMGHMPTGKKVSMNVIEIVGLKDGKYIDHWSRNDFMQVIQSL